MSKKGDLRFSPGNSGILFRYEPSRETQARREIERFLSSERFNDAEKNHITISPQLNCNSPSFFHDLEKEMCALSSCGGSLGAPHAKNFAPCISKVRGYLPYIQAPSTRQISTVLWKIFVRNTTDDHPGTPLRFVHSALPYSRTCWSDVAYISKESVKVIEESIRVYKELRMKCANESNDSKIHFAVQVTVRAHSSLQSHQSSIKCRFLSECWKISDELEYDASILHSDVKGRTSDSPGSILYHVTVLSQATFLGYIFDAEWSNVHSFNPNKIRHCNSKSHDSGNTH
uniref:Uncharacterized protein n=1 Tax=Paramoeba aestuarina TaxID=180227 RepID=A0A7S4KNE5_9EUKA|mmetsp:Transcript_22143/g.34392  ORF Transcript_22143/g.34392 Transcript_22143/m.34392 type:complete len:287 (+) Transcript_22143:793-1653(+)